MLLPSVLGLALCFVCLAATTWAWFMVSVTSEANTIQTANFDVNVAVTDGTTPVNAVDGVYTLNTGTAYTVTITKTGTASKGYCAVTIDGTDYYTQQITSNYTFTLNVTGTGTAGVTFTPSWGDAPAITTYSLREPAAVIVDGATIEIVGNGEETVDENQQEEEQENQQQEEKEETPSDENNPADDPENNGEGENTSTDTPTDGDGNEEQQPDGSSDPADGEGGQQGGETPDVSEGNGDNNGETDNTGDDTITGGETPTDTPTPTGGEAPTEPVVTTDSAAQSEGGAPANPAPSE